jgi:hypothetical protein
MTTPRRVAPMPRRWKQLLAGLVLGVLPGVLLVLVAQFVVTGEPQLTVGVAGMWLAAVGAVAGFVVALLRTRGRPGGH